MNYKNLLIADSGSTKTSWCLLTDGKEIHAETQGISPYFLNKKEIKEVLLKELLPAVSFDPKQVGGIFFYGTGLSAPENATLVKDILSKVFERAAVQVSHDLMGAARGLCQGEKGLACILGTGSGACYFDGTNIVKSSPGLGFILGDEGSGAYLGKILVQRYLYHSLGAELTHNFEAKYQPEKAEILKKVYKEPYPNRYLASYARFLGENKMNPDAKEIIEKGITDFLLQHVKRYEESRDVQVHFVGGVAKALEDEVVYLCKKNGLKPGRILQKPLDGLIRYHKKYL